MDGFARVLAFVLIRVFGHRVMWVDHVLAAWWNRIRTNGWPTTEARVHQVTTLENGSFWHANLSYSYAVAGEFYSGFFTQPFAREKDAQAFAETFRRGLPFQVHYNPHRNDASIATYEELYRAAATNAAVTATAG